MLSTDPNVAMTFLELRIIMHSYPREALFLRLTKQTN